MATMSILLATDGSPEALSAAEWLDRWASPDAVRITVVSVISPPTMPWTTAAGTLTLDSEAFTETYQDLLDAEKVQAHKAIDETRKQLKRCAPNNEEILVGSPPKSLVEYAQKHRMDLIVMGRRGHSALGNLMGSVSFGVVHRSPIPVTVVN